MSARSTVLDVCLTYDVVHFDSGMNLGAPSTAVPAPVSTAQTEDNLQQLPVQALQEFALPSLRDVCQALAAVLACDRGVYLRDGHQGIDADPLVTTAADYRNSLSTSVH